MKQLQGLQERSKHEGLEQHATHNMNTPAHNTHLKTKGSKAVVDEVHLPCSSSLTQVTGPA